MAEHPAVTGRDVPAEEDGENFVTPMVSIDQDKLIIVDWPEGRKSQYVQMATPLFEEWVAMMNALQRFADLTVMVAKIEATGGEPSEDMLKAISRLHMQLRLG